MAIMLAALNRRLLIDTSDPEVDRGAEKFLASRKIKADVRSLVLDNDRSVAFGHARHKVPDSNAVGDALKAYMSGKGKTIDQVFWRFSVAAPPA